MCVCVRAWVFGLVFVCVWVRVLVFVCLYVCVHVAVVVSARTHTAGPGAGLNPTSAHLTALFL